MEKDQWKKFLKEEKEKRSSLNKELNYRLGKVVK